MSGEVNEMLEKLAQHEEAIGQLYDTYSGIFPSLFDFWTLLSQEESQHANWIRTLGKKVAEDPKLFVNEHRFNTVAIDTSLDYLQKEIGKATMKPVSIIEALTAAFYVEQSLIESKIFEVFETDSVELKHLFQQLQKDTVKHRIKVREALDRQKNMK